MATEEREIAKGEENEWHSVNRVLFRFGFIYLFFLIFPFPFTAIPLINYVSIYYSKLINEATIFFSTHIMHVPLGALKMNGSGDPLFRYMEFSLYLCIAILGAILWSVLDRKRKNYQKLYKWLRFYSRIYLATVLISYATCKIIPTQFPAPGLTRLVQSFGDASPMGLMWTFMGASKSYTIFTGFAELIPGLLLLFSRTTTLGALISFAVFVNVFMLNMSYDVPVKLFSFHYLLLSLFILIPDIKGLFRLLCLKKAPMVEREAPLIENKPRLNKCVVALQIFLAIFLTGGGLYTSYFGSKQFDMDETKVKFYGIWSVKNFSVDDQAPEYLNQPDTWRYLIFEFPKNAAIITQDGTKTWISKRELKEDGSVQLWSGNKNNSKQNYLVSKTENGDLQVYGTRDGKKLKITLQKMDRNDFLLLKRGFHWINEYPYNK